MEMKMKMEKKLISIGLAVILGLAVFAAVIGIASADTYYNETGNYIEGINVTVNTTIKFNESDCCTPLEFLINNTLNSSATSFNVTTQPGLTTDATNNTLNDSLFWVNASIADTYWVNVSNNGNSSEYVYFTVEYSSITTTTYNETGEYIEGINVSVNTSDNMYFNRSCINVPLTFQINTLNESATNFSVANQTGLTTNATDSMKNDSWFWVNATEAGTYCIKVFNKDNQSEYVYFTVEYLSCLLPQACEIKPETLNLGSKGVFTAFITLPEDFPAGYNVTDINISTVECEGAPADSKERIDGDKFIAKFNREDLRDDLRTGDAVTLNVTWKLDDGTLFECNATIRVIDKRGLGPKFVLGHLLDGVKKWGKGVYKKIPGFGIADEAASQPDTTPPVPTNTMHVDNITMSRDNRSAGPNTFVWAVAAVTIVDEFNNPVEGAMVYGQWSNATSDSDSEVTDTSGQVSLKSKSVNNPKTGTTFTFTVDDVVKTDGTYNSSANKKTDDSITV